ncbi:MAG: tRNA (adenosine(37)-N6)-dimethylallyltransferase MiaA [Candidatus Dormibacteria bacterium]
MAVALARRLDGEVISFDSRQVYRGVEVSSNAPTAAERELALIRLVGVLDPDEHLTAARYVGMARDAVRDCGPTRTPVLTAGTGLYLKAYLDGMDLGGMGAVPGLREELEAEAARDLPGLARRLHELSPGLAAQTDVKNPVRVVRRMELLWAAALAGAAGEATPSGRVDALKVGLRVPPAELEATITARIDHMLASGWHEEVAALLGRDPPAAPQVLKSIGVAEMASHLRGEIDEAELRHVVLLRTRQYAKRQRTWFRGDPEVRWVEAGNSSTSDIVASILEILFDA